MKKVFNAGLVMLMVLSIGIGSVFAVELGTQVGTKQGSTTTVISGETGDFSLLARYGQGAGYGNGTRIRDRDRLRDGSCRS